MALMPGLWLSTSLGHAAEPVPVEVQEARTPAVLPGDQTIVSITVEDEGNRIEELRYGGITESINVNPKSGFAPYEVQATDGAHSHPVERDMNPSPLGSRLWNLFDF
jgi:hypothetical protein